MVLTNVCLQGLQLLISNQLYCVLVWSLLIDTFMELKDNKIKTNFSYYGVLNRLLTGRDLTTKNLPRLI